MNMKRRVWVVLLGCCITFTAANADALSTAKSDIKKLAASIKKSKNRKLFASAKLGAQDYAFAVVRVNSGWQKLPSAQRKTIAKSWWVQWATLRARYEQWVAVTVEDARGKELLNCQGDSRGSGQCE